MDENKEFDPCDCDQPMLDTSDDMVFEALMVRGWDSDELEKLRAMFR